LINISEIFYSLQGEGSLAGVASSFVRLAGCNLRCRWCDSGYARQEKNARPMTVEQVVEQVSQYNSRHVVVTGGEPLIADELPGLLEELARPGKHITVETNATLFREITCDLISISPKPASSAGADEDPLTAGRRLNIDAIRRFISSFDYQLKFVVEGPQDLPEIKDIIGQLPGIDRKKIFLMPQADTKSRYRALAPKIARICLENDFRFSPRLQVELWGGRRGR